MKSLGIITCDDTYHYWGDIMISYEQEWQLHQSHKIPAFEGWYFRVVDNHKINRKHLFKCFIHYVNQWKR